MTHATLGLIWLSRKTFPGFAGLRAAPWNLFGPKDKNRRDCEEIQYTGWTDVKEKTHAGVIVQKLETEDTLTGLTDVEENVYVGALADEDRGNYIHRLNRWCIGQLHRFSCPERCFLEEREEVTLTG